MLLFLILLWKLLNLQVEIDLGDGKKGYVDIPQEQFVGNTPMNLTLGKL